MMENITLKRDWSLGPELAEGGFARIHEAESDIGEPAVIKLIPKDPGAERELLFENLAEVPNVLPILDSGEWEDYWVLVMPRAERPLRQHLTEHDGSLTVGEAVGILLDITTALEALEADVVHRDLKPENVLLYDGHWCLADFGIARYAEATTAPDTRKHAMTPPYAAPEQWRGERATGATDIYALGVMGYEMVAGHRPFPGPDVSDYREQHLQVDAPTLTNCPAPVASLIAECLFKAPQARPTAANVRARLEAAEQRPLSAAARRLQEVNRAAVERRAAADTAASAARSEAERREELAKAAKAVFEQIRAALRANIIETAPESVSHDVWSDAPAGWPLRLNGAQLIVGLVREAHPSPNATYPLFFDVVAYSEIHLRIPSDQWGYEGRSHSLWFCDAQEAGIYRWHESAFMFSALIQRSSSQEPFALEPGDESGVALSNVTGEFQVAWPFMPIDQGEEGAFIERWMDWFADATQGKLRHPRYMPERDPKGSWRQS